MEGDHSLEVRWKWSTGSKIEWEHQESDGRGAPGVRRKGSTRSQTEGEHQELDGKVTFRPSERSGHLWKITVA